MTLTEWKPALVAVDVFFGPYPALIPAHAPAGELLVPRFSWQVVERIAADTAAAAMETGNGPVVLIRDGHAVSTTIHDFAVEPGASTEPGADGLFPLAAPIGNWSVVDIKWTRDGECECGTCDCPAQCAACAEPVGGGHARSCIWWRGSAPWERPAIAAALAVLDTHRHRPGCPFVRRSPGPLFMPGHTTCQFCGTAGRRSAHTLTTAGGAVSHHQRCLACGQVWFSDAPHMPPPPRRQPS